MSRGRRREHLRGARVAEQPHRGVVGVDEPPVGRLRGHRVGDALEDRRRASSRASRSDVCRRALSIASAQRSASSCAAREVVLARTGAPTRRSRARCRRSPRRGRAAARSSTRPSRPRAGSAGAPGPARRPPELVRDLRLELGLAGADHLRRADRRVRVERVAPVVLAHDARLAGSTCSHHARARSRRRARSSSTKHQSAYSGTASRATVAASSRSSDRASGSPAPPVVRRRLAAHGAQSMGLGEPLGLVLAQVALEQAAVALLVVRGSRSPCPASPSRARR